MQNRLTGKDEQGAYLICTGDYEDMVDEAITRLAAYEDTGLEPKEITEYLNATDEYVRASEEGRLIVLPETGIGDLSDGYHTFNGLCYQRMILFATLVKAYKNRAWKSLRHDDGELCFGGGWFIVGVDTPEGSYTYHYENKDFDLFDCEELPIGKHWDGHTEDDVTRLLSLEAEAALGGPNDG